MRTFSTEENKSANVTWEDSVRTQKEVDQELARGIESIIHDKVWRSSRKAMQLTRHKDKWLPSRRPCSPPNQRQKSTRHSRL